MIFHKSHNLGENTGHDLKPVYESCWFPTDIRKTVKDMRIWI